MVALQISPKVESLLCMDQLDRPQNYKNLYGSLQLLQGSHLDNFPLKTVKLGWVAFNSLTFQLKCLDFQCNQFTCKKLASVLSRFCNGLWLCVKTRFDTEAKATRKWPIQWWFISTSVCFNTQQLSTRVVLSWVAFLVVSIQAEAGSTIIKIGINNRFMFARFHVSLSDCGRKMHLCVYNKTHFTDG